MASTYYDEYRNDERLTQVTKAGEERLSGLEKEYADRKVNIQEGYQSLVDQTTKWENEQIQIQQDKSDLAIEKLEENQKRAEEDYKKEQTGAFVDWKKQSNPYGANAEKMAANGLAGTGYSESSQVSMYNQYQNRIAVARASFDRISTDYDIAMNEARMQNSAALAEIAMKAQQDRLDYMLQSTLKINTLLSELTQQKLAVQEFNALEYQRVLDQINKEKSFEEAKRQAELENAREQERIKIEQAELKLQQDKFAYQKEQDAAAKAAISKSSGGSSGGGSKKSSRNAAQNKNKKSTITTTTKTAKTKVTTPHSGKSSKNAPVDMNSVLSLGYGPISAARAYELVKQGLATTYVKNGKTYFRKSATYLKNQRLFG